MMESSQIGAAGSPPPPPLAALQGAGARLREERERRGMSLDKAADELHLVPDIAAALEADDYATVGPPVYVKGHLKRYARLVEVAEDEVIEAYLARASGRPASVETAPAERAPIAPVAPLHGVRAAVVVAAVLFGAGAIVLKTHRGADAGHPSAETSAQAGAQAAAQAGVTGGVLQSVDLGAEEAETRAARIVAPSSSAAPAAMASAGPAQTASAAPAAIRGTGRARLRLSFSADSWVEVRDAAGNRVFAGNQRANSVRTLSGDAPMQVYLRSANGVQLEINRHAVAIGRRFMAGDEARFEAGADGVLRREPPAAPPVAQARPTG